MASTMRLLSSNPLPGSKFSLEEEQPTVYKVVANDCYIAISLNNGVIHVLSSKTGLSVLEDPFYQPGKNLIGGLVFDRDYLITSFFKSPDLVIFGIYSG